MNLDIYTLVTNIGKAKIANATVTGSKVDFFKLKVGDGNGAYYEPNENQTDLMHTVWSGNVNNVLTGGENNPNWIIVQTMISPAEGGFYIREAGIFDNDNNLLAISKYPESYKPTMDDGSTDDLTVELIFEVSNSSVINLKIDPLVTTASIKDLKNLETKINQKIESITEQMKDIANNKASKTELEDLKNTVANIDLSATKVNLATINGMSAKNVQSGIQELFTFASNGKNAIAGKVGNITGNNTHAEIANRIQTDKNTAASALNAKNVSASGNEALASLVSKIANISIQGMGGKEFVIGNTRGLSLENKTKFNVVWGGFGVGYENEEYYANVQLGFNPSIFIAYGRAGDGDDYDKATCSTVINNICFFSTATGNSTGGYGNLYQPKYLNGVFTFPTRPNRNLTYIAFK
ncbi:phage tail protein [Clostridium cagae]|uniref:phage tail protein n=2 Tax=Clostridium cagae TaxID=2080751 RepID=UPI003F76578D